MGFESKGKTWGANFVAPYDHDLPGLKMRYLCESLDRRSGRLLEIGSSAGKHLRSLIELGYGFDCNGTDIDRDSIRLGHKTERAISFVVADGHHLPYADCCFDVLLIMDYLEHVENPQQAIDETLRILSDDGMLYMFVPCEANPLSAYALFNRLFGFNVKNPSGGTFNPSSQKRSNALD